ncbi:LysR substrate-binding domain-containing protein [Macrococcoides caseolyticum]|uniref:LysR substrate-binding domain-containing protein n=1 Tax=Macrococcoides caseolyticum TaxID=69966 RepID=UPI002D809F0F|nr:LysR substrate-binding domain-containing protein [Macrococcus caseolyticus]
MHFIQEGSIKLQHMLANDEIDIGLNSFPQVNDEILMEPLHTTTQGYDVSVVMHKHHPLADRQSIGFKDLKTTAFSAFTNDFMLGQMITDRARYFGYEPKIVFVNNDWEVLAHSVENFMSVALIPSAYEPFSTIKDIVWIPLADKNNYYPIGISLRKGYVCSHEMNEFISIIKTN